MVTWAALHSITRRFLELQPATTAQADIRKGTRMS